MKGKGLIYIVSAPSGAGKSTVISRFLKKHRKDFVLSISVTTRPPRGKEKDGREYYFVNREKFARYVKEGRFLEYATVVGKRYGTLKKTVFVSVNKGKNVIMDIDIQGARKIRRRVKNCVTVFIVPPTYAELKKRLIGRRTDTKEAIRKRLALAKKELKERQKYDYIIVNKDLREAVSCLEAIVKLEQFKRHAL